MKKFNLDKFSKDIYKLRKENKYSQAYIEEKTGINRITLGKMEKGEFTPSIEKLEDLCELYNLDPLNYFMEERFQKKLEEYQEEFINSDEYKNLKELDLKLEKDEELLKLVKIKKDIEDKLSSNYLISSDSEKENLLKEYKKINDEINKLPIVIEYNNAYNKIKRIKNIFEDELLRKLVW